MIDLYPFVARAIIFPLGDRARGIPISRRIAELERSQWWSREEHAEHQNQLLRALVRDVYQHVPYYRRVMDERRLVPSDIKTRADLEKLPVLTKDIIRREGKNLEATNIDPREVSHAHTGGSTGEPLNFLHDREAQAVQQAAFRRGLAWGGLKWGERVVSISGGLLGTRRVPWKEHVRRAITRNYHLPAFELRRDTTAHYATILRRMRPRALIGYTSTLYELARLCRLAGERVEIPIVFTTAEILFPFHVREIEVAFGAKVFDYYGCGEVNSLAFQCEERTYHVTDEKVVLEVEPITEGHGGRLLMTDLTNRAFPFIRYENGDRVTLGSKACRCGRHLSSIEAIHGRVHDFIVTSSGDLLAGEFFPHLFGFSEGVVEYQIVQERLGELRVRLVPGPGFTQTQEHWLVGKLKEYVGADMQVSVEKTDRIERTQAGKLRVTVSHLDLRDRLTDRDA